MNVSRLLILLAFLTACATPEGREEDGASTGEKNDSITEYRGELPYDTLREDSSNGIKEYRGPIPFDTLREDTSGKRYQIDYDTGKWTDLHFLEPGIRIDLRYATENNFVGEKMYECARCFLRPAVAKAVVEVHKILQEQGLGLKMFDCYRPRPIQWKLWEKVPDRRYVADPEKGSVHNRGGAVDLTIVDDQGNQLAMGTPYDFFGEEAYQSYTELPDSVLANRRLLKKLMEAHGFRSIRTEWWHYSFNKENYPLADMMWKCPSK